MNNKRGPTAIGALIASYRQQKGLTQTELSERVDMSQEWTSQVERGKIKRPRVDVLRRISKVLDAPLEQLIAATGYQNAAGVLGRLLPEEIEDPEIARAYEALTRLSHPNLKIVQTVLDALLCLQEGSTARSSEDIPPVAQEQSDSQINEDVGDWGPIQQHLAVPRSD